MTVAVLTLACGEAPPSGADAGETGPGTHTGAHGDASPDVATETETETGQTGGTGDTGDTGEIGSTGVSLDTGETGDEAEPWTYPEPDWDVEPPAEHGMDPDALAAVDQVAADAGTGCLVVTRHGVLVHEWYADGWAADTQTEVFSVTKSVTSVLVGVAMQRGLLSVDDFASDYVAPWLTTDAATVTIGQLLQQDSGRHWDFFGDYVTLDVVEGDKTQYAIDLAQQHLPGQWWEYNNAGVQALEAVVRAAVGGDDVDAWAQDNLFAPIGMAASFGHDAAGNTMTYAHLRSDCRSLARLGYLYLRGGQWADAETIVSESWVEASTTGRTEHNDAYGYLWWLNQPGHWIRPSLPDRREGDGLLLPTAPIGAYTARGLGAQIVAVDPGSEIVFTRLATIPVQDLFAPEPDVEHDLWSAIMQAVLD